jgi:hypothetical protein
MAETITLTDLSCCCDEFHNDPCNKICCNNTLPDTLYLTLTDTNCAAFEGLVITLTWTAGTCDWRGSTTISCDGNTYTVLGLYGCIFGTTTQVAQIRTSLTHDCFTAADQGTTACQSPFLMQVVGIDLLVNDFAEPGGCAKCCDNPFAQLTGTMTVTE